MAKQMMFYEKVVPISLERHESWAVRQGEDFTFAAETNAVPLMCAEFNAVATELPIVFAKNETGTTPVVVLGISPNKSLMIDTDGAWKGRYVPAFLRRYPFVFAQSDETTYTLCIDEAHTGCDSDGKAGERLYSEKGEPTEFLTNALEFTKNVATEAQRTAAFCKMLDDNDLLQAQNAAITMADGEKQALTGFHIVSREKLKAIGDDVLKEMFDRDALELIYYHLLSVRNMETLRRLASG
ncbi:MAG: SapC family protein [Pseudomonadota bacterium]